MNAALVSAVAACGLIWASPPSIAHGQPIAPCGPDQATAVESARKHTPHDPFTQTSYDRVPVASNYDACANLSTVLLPANRLTPNAPIQAFLFNRGRFVGTAFESRPYTTLNASASTRDMVVLDFVTDRTCSDCGDGRTQSVRYVWDGRVRTLDRHPQETSLP